MKSPKFLFIVLLLEMSLICASAQTFKVSNGLSVSSIKGETEVFDFFDGNRYDYSGFVGLDFFHHKYFYLSGEMGYASKGGKKMNPIRESADDFGRYKKMTKGVNYLHLNTTFRVKYPAKNYYFYVGIGPKVDFLMSDDVFAGDGLWWGYIKKENPTPPPSDGGIHYPVGDREIVIFENYTFNRVLFGFKPEIGFDYSFADRFMLGFNASYHINTNNVGKCRYIKLENLESIQKDLHGKTFLFMLTFGYKLYKL